MAQKQQSDPFKQPASQYIRVLHPRTRRFMFEYDPVRHTIMVSDRGRRVCIDLARLAEEKERKHCV